MIIYVLNKVLEVIGIIEDYYSLTWAERYSICGDFELELPINYDGSPLIEFGNFLYISSSNTLMIIEDMKPSTTEETTNLVLKGESAESLLKRRALQYPTSSRYKEGTAEAFIYKIMSLHITNPPDPNRKIDLFIDSFPPQTRTDPFDDQFDIQTIYDMITKVCKGLDYGVRVLKDVKPSEPVMLSFSIYEGVDRSYSQTTNPFVIFSENYGNVISSSFYLSEKGKVNLVNVYTDDPIYETVNVWEEGAPEPEGLDRFEIALDTSIDRDIDAGDPLTDAEVLSIIETRARAIIKDKKTVGVFEGDF